MRPRLLPALLAQSDRAAALRHAETGARVQSLLHLLHVSTVVGLLLHVITVVGLLLHVSVQ